VDLLERDGDLAAVTALLPKAGAGGALALLGAGAGGGKTAFLRAAAARLEGRADVHWGECDPIGTPRPLGAVMDFAPALVGRAADTLGVDGAGRERFFRELLERLRAPGPRFVVIEDVHWADEATLDLLRFVGRRIASTRALLVCSYRDDGLGPDHPLRLLLGQLAGRPSVRRLTLAPLSLAAVRSLSAGTGLDPAELHRRTGGNPFFVTEVLAAAREPGSRGGGAPATVRDAVLARAAVLDPPARAVLEASALLGARAEPWLLESLLGDAESAMDACVAHGMLEHAGDALSFRHELARDALAESIPPERRRRLHAAVLAALEAAPDRAIDVARLAHHAEQAHDAAAVLAYAPEAGRQAARLGAHREAARQFARALRFSGGAEAAERAALLEAFAQAHRVIAYTREALEAEEAAVRLWRGLGNGRAEGAALARLAGLYAHRGRTDDAEAASSKALELLGSAAPTPELGHAQVVQATLRVRARDNAEAVLWGERALASAQLFDDAELAVRAHCRIAAGLLLQDLVGGEDHLARARELAERAELRRVAALPHVTAASVAVERYRFADARRSIEDGLATCRELDLDSDALYLRSLRALVDTFVGEWHAAMAAADDIAREPEVETLTRVMALLALGRLRARRGDSGADRALDEALALAEPTRSLQRLGPVRAARAEAAWIAGDRPRVVREAEAGYALAFERRHAWMTGELGYWLARAGGEPTLPAWAAAPFRLEAEGSFAAAAAAWRAIGCPYEEARALASSGEVDALRRALEGFERLGAHPAASASARALRALGARAIPRGPRPATRANPAGLTPRESQVVTLLVRGATNRAIGSELHISPKTAAHHVSAILAKLGVARRTEVAVAARRLGLAPAEGAGGEPSGGEPGGAEPSGAEPSGAEPGGG